MLLQLARPPAKLAPFVAALASPAVVLHELSRCLCGALMEVACGWPEVAPTPPPFIVRKKGQVTTLQLIPHAQLELPDHKEDGALRANPE